MVAAGRVADRLVVQSSGRAACYAHRADESGISAGALQEAGRGGCSKYVVGKIGTHGRNLPPKSNVRCGFSAGAWVARGSGTAWIG